ncbi:zinc finger protein ZAT4-like [Triticum aestivum]|uniref:zinc finger protein ZAT4-like n=1 Tax=Triticum aestivum TaxID=4565 RepID=UPI001D021B87|nr:zinc finger protein ZAT4-like [Triticum aestivum]
MADSADGRPAQSPRRRREVEEGEVASGYYTGSDTDTDDEDARYFLHSLPLHDHRQHQKVTVARPGPGPVVEDVVSAGTRKSRSRSTTRRSSPSSSLGSDGTISDDGHAGGDIAAVTALFPACPVCHRHFHSSKAVHGHMRVHAQAQPKEEAKASATVSAVDEVADSVSVSTAYVVEEPKTPDDPMTLEVATSDQVVAGSGSSRRSSSVEPSQSAAFLSMAIVVAEAAAPAAAPNQVDIAPTPPAHRQDPVPPLVAPAPEPAAVYLHPPTAAQQHAAAVPPLAFHSPLHQDPAAPRGFSCKECNRWFETHQGLGGHVAGHKNRRIAAAAAAAIAAGVDPIAAGGPRPEKLHTCKVCGEVYSSGVRLGGHMRKHYTGKPIVPRKRARLLLPPDVIGLAIPGPAPAMEAPVVAPAVLQQLQAPVVPPGCLRLFGVTIMQEVKKEEEPTVDEKQ